MATGSTTVVVNVTIPADIRKALRAVEKATGTLANVASLPPSIGSRVRWRNGLIWTRVGEDEWQPNEPALTLEEARAEDWTAPSAHIAASGDFEILVDAS